MAQKILKWFITEPGKKFTFGIACCTSVGICAACTVPHTVLLNKYREVVQLYESGIPVKLSQTVLKRYEKALELLDMQSYNQAYLKPFAMFGFDLFSAGSLHSRYGGIIGIPTNFNYMDQEQVDKTNIMVNNECVDWSREEGQQLLDSLTLSENAQIFAIAREIKYLSTFKLLLNTFYSAGVFIAMYGTGHRLNTKYNLYARPLSLRLVIYSAITLFGYGLHSFLTDYTQASYDKRVDQELCDKHALLAEGGREFYNKMLVRNRALRKLLGKYGEGQYSVQGNENFLFRQRQLPLVNRRDFFNKRLKGAV